MLTSCISFSDPYTDHIRNVVHTIDVMACAFIRVKGYDSSHGKMLANLFLALLYGSLAMSYEARGSLLMD